MALDTSTRELIANCLDRLAAGDANAGFDLASLLVSHADALDVGLNLALIEALATLAKHQGSAEATDFLSEQWPEMKVILGKRWRRAGFS